MWKRGCGKGKERMVKAKSDLVDRHQLVKQSLRYPAQVDPAEDSSCRSQEWVSELLRPPSPV